MQGKRHYCVLMNEVMYAGIVSVPNSSVVVGGWLLNMVTAQWTMTAQ